MDKSSDIFKIKPVGNINTVVEDKRKTISPFNATKHFRDAELPALCDQCVYRSIEEGGNGKCPKYEKGAVCAIRKDFITFINELDTRNPEDLKSMMDLVTKIVLENVLMAVTHQKFDGNISDRNTKSEINTLINLAKLTNELNEKVVITETKEFKATGDIANIFTQIKAQRNNAKTD